MIDESKRQLLALGGALAAATFSPNSIASVLVAQTSDCVVQARRLFSVDETLRVPAIAALFDEKKHAILQLDYADFETVTRPLRANTESQMWALSFDLPTNVDHSNTRIQSVRSALKTEIAFEHEILNVLAVFSCNPQVSAVSLLRRYQPLLASVAQPTGLYGFGVVAEDGISNARMTLLCVTQRKA